MTFRNQKLSVTLQHSGFLFNEKTVSTDHKVSSSQEYLVDPVGTYDYHEVEEREDEDSIPQVDGKL